MRTFKIIRIKDESGISGTGHVIDGVIFDDDTTVIQWLTDTSSIAIYKSFADFKFLHIDSHPSNETKIVFNEAEKEAEDGLNKLKPEEIEKLRKRRD